MHNGSNDIISRFCMKFGLSHWLWHWLLTLCIALPRIRMIETSFHFLDCIILSNFVFFSSLREWWHELCYIKVELPQWPCALIMNEAGSSSMNVIRFRWRHAALFISAIGVLVLYNEWLIYYFILLQCQWPTLDVETNDFTVNDDHSTAKSPLRVMALADTHMLGTREGHWFDKLRRLVIIYNVQLFVVSGFG